MPLWFFRNSHHLHWRLTSVLGCVRIGGHTSSTLGARRMVDYLFLAGFFAVGGALANGAGGSLCSGTLAKVKIWVC